MYLCSFAHVFRCSQRVHSLLSLEAHLLSPLPPQLHAAIKVIVHDAQKILLTFSLKDTIVICVLNSVQSVNQ